VRRPDFEISPTTETLVARKDAVAIAREVMAIAADLNRNHREMSVTELPSLLENTPHQEFGRWVQSMKQAGGRESLNDSGGARPPTHRNASNPRTAITLI